MQEVLNGWKFRLYPNKQQAAQINNFIGANRFVYNKMVDIRNQYKNNNGKYPSKKYVTDIISNLKQEEEYKWLKEIDSKSLEQTQRIFWDALDRCFKSNGNSKQPRFHKKQTAGSYTTQLKENWFGDINNGYVKLPKLGVVKIKTHRNVDINRIKQYITISRNSIGEYYISIKVKTTIPDEPTIEANSENTVGVDVGLKDLAISSNGNKYSHIANNRKLIKRKKRLQKQLSRKIGSKKGETKSNNYIKLQRKISKLDVKQSRKREIYHYQVINDLLSDESTKYVGIETLRVKNMMRKGKKHKRAFNRACSRQGLGGFLLKLESKASMQGKKTYKIDTFYPSSKLCNKCGTKNNNLTLNDRFWTCPNCGQTLDRDINAAKNIRDKAIEDINACTHSTLPKCVGKVKSVESETKPKCKNTVFLSTSALNEAENIINNVLYKPETERVIDNVMLTHT